MKIVDENGKLFQKFNLVDTVVVVLLAIVLIAIGYKTVSASITAKQEREAEALAHAYDSNPHLIYDVVCNDVPKEVAEACEAQMERPMAERQLMSLGKPLEGYVTACSYVPQDEDDDSLCTLYFTLEVLPTVKDGIYSLGTQEIRIGKGHIVKTYYIETSGWVYSMEEPNA